MESEDTEISWRLSAPAKCSLFPLLGLARVVRPTTGRAVLLTQGQSDFWTYGVGLDRRNVSSMGDHLPLYCITQRSSTLPQMKYRTFPFVSMFL